LLGIFKLLEEKFQELHGREDVKDFRLVVLKDWWLHESVQGRTVYIDSSFMFQKRPQIATGISAEAGCLLEYAARNPIPADAPEEQLFMVGGEREATSEELDELLEPTLVELDELLEATLVELRHSEPVRPDVVIGPPRKGEAIQDGGSGKASSEGAA
jgi:hypothetical protein